MNVRFLKTKETRKKSIENLLSTAVYLNLKTLTLPYSIKAVCLREPNKKLFIVGWLISALFLFETAIAIKILTSDDWRKSVKNYLSFQNV